MSQSSAASRFGPLLAAVPLLLGVVAAPAHAQRVDNPFAGATWYVNPDYTKMVQSSIDKVSDQTVKGQMATVGRYPTAVWLDRIAAIAGTDGRLSLAGHLDAALAQQKGSQPVTVILVIYNLPGRDCSALASNGELGPTEINRYQTEYINPIAAVLKDPKYASLRIVNIIELDSLPNLITNTNKGIPMCDTMLANGNYVKGVQYALSKLNAIGNVYNYIDAGHHGWLGWDTNLGPAVKLFYDTVDKAKGGPGPEAVQGFITNTSNYSALDEPYFPVDSTTRSSKWISWNQYSDERTYAVAFRQQAISAGFKSNIGMIIDTSRNGWGGPNRPTKGVTSGSADQVVDGSRIDRRIHAGNWCNQTGAGIGEPPRVVDANGIHAYVWVKPPGESDGSSAAGDASQGKSADRMCDPTYGGNERNGNSMTGAMPNAPVAGSWFHAQFEALVKNAYPVIPVNANPGTGGGSGGNTGGGSGGNTGGGSGGNTGGGSGGNTGGGSGGNTGGGSGGGSTTQGDFNVTVAPPSLTMNQGQQGSTTITISKSGSFSSSVSLSVSGLPSGVTASFSPASATSTSVLTLSAATGAATGAKSLTITGTSGSLSRTVTMTLTVNAQGSPSFGLEATPTTVSVARGSSRASTVKVSPTGGFSGAVALTVDGLPSGVTAAFSPASTTATSTLTFTAASNAQAGTSTVTVVGTSGSVVKSLPLTLTVPGPDGDGVDATGCGCGATQVGDLAMAGLVLLAVAALRRRRASAW